jgi:hypothetical protein
MPAYYQFKTLVFGPRISGEVPAVDPAELISGERHIPYSNLTVIDLGGRGPRRFKCTIRVTESDLVAWEDALGTTGDLYVAGQLWPLATLMKLGGHNRTPLDAAPVWHFMEAEWVIGSVY